MTDYIVQENLTRLSHYFKEFMEKIVITYPGTADAIKNEWINFKGHLKENQIKLDEISSYVYTIKPLLSKPSPLKLNVNFKLYRRSTILL